MTLGTPNVAKLLGASEWNASVLANRLLEKHPGTGHALAMTGGETLQLLVLRALANQQDRSGSPERTARRTERTREIAQRVGDEYDLGLRPAFVVIEPDGYYIYPHGCDEAEPITRALIAGVATIVRLTPMIEQIEDEAA